MRKQYWLTWNANPYFFFISHFLLHFIFIFSFTRPHLVVTPFTRFQLFVTPFAFKLNPLDLMQNKGTTCN